MKTVRTGMPPPVAIDPLAPIIERGSAYSRQLVYRRLTDRRNFNYAFNLSVRNICGLNTDWIPRTERLEQDYRQNRYRCFASSKREKRALMFHALDTRRRSLSSVVTKRSAWKRVVLIYGGSCSARSWMWKPNISKEYANRKILVKKKIYMYIYIYLKINVSDVKTYLDTNIDVIM